MKCPGAISSARSSRTDASPNSTEVARLAFKFRFWERNHLISASPFARLTALLHFIAVLPNETIKEVKGAPVRIARLLGPCGTMISLRVFRRFPDRGMLSWQPSANKVVNHEKGGDS